MEIILFGLPIFLVALIIRWIRFIKENSDIQIEQNKEIITLLKEIKALSQTEVQEEK